MRFSTIFALLLHLETSISILLFLTDTRAISESAKNQFRRVRIVIIINSICYFCYAPHTMKKLRKSTIITFAYIVYMPTQEIIFIEKIISNRGNAFGLQVIFSVYTRSRNTEKSLTPLAYGDKKKNSIYKSSFYQKNSLTLA